MVIGEPVVHHAPQLVAGIGVESPPEPAATRLVQRAPQHGYLALFEFLEGRGHFVDVLHHLLVFIGLRLEDFLDIEARLIVTCTWGAGPV